MESMAVSYEQAREIVRREIEPQWDQGTFCLDDRQIVENDEVYAFNVGAREWIVDRDDDYRIRGGLPVVDKATGELSWRASVEIATDETMTLRPNPDPTLVV
jgi:hypothetical protein